MQYISPEVKQILANRLKAGKRRVNVRVEVDKYTYVPNLASEFDHIRFLTNASSPIALEGADNITSATVMISPIEGEAFESLTISSPFAVKAVNGKQRFHPILKVWKDHKGIDISKPLGTGVVAVADGVVSKCGYNDESAGNWIKLSHVNGYETRYLHLSKIVVKEGDRVVQGQKIGEVGSTGLSTGAHLHFEVLKDGQAVDPVSYLKRESYIQDVPEYPISGTATVSTTVPVYAQPSSQGYALGNLLPGDSVTLLARRGEWYKVDASSVRGIGIGYVHNKKVNANISSGSSISRLDRIKIAAKNAAQRVGFDHKFLLAICKHETQLGTAGWGKEERGSYVLGYGCYSDTEADPKYAGIETQMYYGAKRVEDALASRKYQIKSWNDVEYFHNGGDMGTGYTWSQDYPNWVNSVWSIYQDMLANPSEWDVDAGLVNATIPSGRSGVVTGNAVNVRSSKDYSTDTNIIAKVNKGTTLEYIATEGEWCKIKLPDQREGYIFAKYFSVNKTALSTAYDEERVFYEDFESYAPYARPAKNFTQSATQSWMVANDGTSNVLKCFPATTGVDSLQFTATIQNAGKLELKYKHTLVDGNKFNVYVDNALVLSKTGNVTEYETFTVALLPGTHIFRIERDKKINGHDTIIIDNIAVYQYSYKGAGVDDSTFARQYQNTFNEQVVRVIADSANIMETTQEGSSVIRIADRGELLTYVSTSQDGNWYLVHDYGVKDQNLGWVKADLTELITREQNSLIVKTGAYVYERTLVLDNIISVDIDYKFEMRSAEAVITISNENGWYSPDYKPQYFPELGQKVSPFTDYIDGEPVGVLTENTPIRIYLGYGDNPPRRFTGLIDSVDMDSETKRIIIRCSDMMKKLNDYYTYEELAYPPDYSDTAWLVSSVIQDMVHKAGLTSWRVIAEDRRYPDAVIEESYYTEVHPSSGYYVGMQDGKPVIRNYDSIPVDGGYKNPCIWVNKPFPVGTCLGEATEELCQNIGYWQRCDFFGTYRATPVKFSDVPVFTFRDTENIVSVSKTIDYTRTRNHLIIVGGGTEEHFFDLDLYRSVKCQRKTARVYVDWADTYGKKQAVAQKMFNDMKMSSRTLQVVVEGNPYLELLDTIAIEDKATTTFDNFVIKGMRDSYSEGQGYLTFLDLFWYRR